MKLAEKKQRNELKIGSILTYINLLISTIIPLLYTPVMLRILGQSEYGLYSLSNSVIGYLSLLNFGLGGATVRYITKCRVEGDKDKVRSITGLFILIFTVLAAIVCITGFLLTNGTGLFFGAGLTGSEIERMKVLMVIMTISTAISFPISVLSSVVVSYEKYIFRKMLDGISTIMLPILNLIILYAGYASIGMAFVGLVIQLIYGVIFYCYCKKSLGITPKYKNMPTELLKEIIGFSAFVFLSTIVDMLYWATDKVLIGAMVGTVAVAIYNIGGTFTGMLQNMSLAISNVFGTRVNTMVFNNSDTKQLSELLIRIGRLQYFVVSFILSGYITFGKVFIHFWAGDSYALAYYIGLLTMIPLAVPLIQNIAYSVVVAQNKHQFRAIIYAFIAVLNVAGTIWAIPQYGIIGAAVCTAVAFLIGNGLIMNIYYYRVTGLDILGFWKNIVKISVVPVVLVVSGSMIINYIITIKNFMQFGIGVVVYTILFFVFSWLLSMNQYEKNLLIDIIKK